MPRKLLILIFAGAFHYTLSQQSTSVDPSYLEDQLYLNLTYNVLNKRPDSITAKGLSNGISFGYIKDIPFNKERNFGLGIGVGYGRNTYYQNLKIAKENGNTVFEPLINVSFDSNKFSMHMVEVPLELRWRTSTANLYKFWRVYTGMKFSYVFLSNAKLKQDVTTKINNIEELNRFQYGFTISAGYGTWNVNVYYGLNKLFSDARLSTTEEPIKMNDLRVGLIFYIL